MGLNMKVWFTTENDDDQEPQDPDDLEDDWLIWIFD